MPQGKFITFEGGEGVGKSTHIALAAEHLRQKGIQVLQTREPGGTPVGETIRHILQQGVDGSGAVPRAELLLFCASRAQLVEHQIRPALEQGIWVLCDRYEESTLAYQGAGRGFDRETVLTLSRFATNGLQPHLTFLLDLDPMVGRARVAARGGTDRIESEALAFHQRLRACFLELATAGSERFVVVDSSRPQAEVSKFILGELDRRMGA
ncbi:MAG: dTMP kinase [Kiritimatiellia bacterium]